MVSGLQPCPHVPRSSQPPKSKGFAKATMTMLGMLAVAGEAPYHVLIRTSSPEL